MSLQGAFSIFSFAIVILQNHVAEMHPTVNKANAAAYMCGFVCYREVVQAGSAVTSLKEGDRVALEPGIPCWSHKMSRQDAASGDTKKRDANSCIILQLDQTTS